MGVDVYEGESVLGKPSHVTISTYRLVDDFRQ